MKKLAILGAFLAALCASADVAVVAPPGSVSGTVTNAVTAPRGMAGWAELDIIATMPTNAPAVFSVFTYDGTGTAFRAVSPYAPPQTNTAAATVFTFPAAAVNRSLFLVIKAAEGAAVTNAALLRYTPTQPRQ